MAMILQFGGSGLKYEDTPIQPKEFHAFALHQTSQIKMTWINPTTDKNFAMVKIIRKVGSVPHDFSDGTLVYSGNGEEFVDSDVKVSTTDNKIKYYYRIFSCNAKGQPNMELKGCYQVGIVYNRSQVKTLGDVINDFVADKGSLQVTDDNGDYEYVPVCFGRYKSTDTATENKLIWKVADRQCLDSDKYVSLVLMTNLGSKRFDYPENLTDNPNPNTDRKNNGNNRYLYSNIRQWMNSSNAANDWYTAQHDYDRQPEYAANHGFLHSFTEEEIGCIMPKELKLGIPGADGGGTETMNDMVWLPSVYEVGLAGTTTEFTREKNPDTQKIFEVFTNNASRMWSSGQWWWLRTAYASFSYYVRCVNGSGALNVGNAYSNGGVRPGLNIPSSLFVQWSDDVQAWEYVPASGGGIKTLTIYGNSVQDGTPSPDSPVEVESVGELQENGKYKIPIQFNKLGVSETYNIYLDEPLRKIGDYADELKFDFENRSVSVVRNVFEINVLSENVSNVRESLDDVISFYIRKLPYSLMQSVQGLANMFTFEYGFLSNVEKAFTTERDTNPTLLINISISRIGTSSDATDGEKIQAFKTWIDNNDNSLKVTLVMKESITTDISSEVDFDNTLLSIADNAVSVTIPTTSTVPSKIEVV